MQSCKKLTLSGTQENFSEIIKGTPSMAAKEEGKKKEFLYVFQNIKGKLVLMMRTGDFYFCLIFSDAKGS